MINRYAYGIVNRNVYENGNLEFTMLNPNLRLLRPAPYPLVLYFRPRRSDSKALLTMLAEDRTSFFGAIFDPRWPDIQREFRFEIQRRGLESILDTNAMELATPGGYTKIRAKLPWAGPDFHRPDDLEGTSVDRFLDAIVADIADKSYSAVLAPTHYISEPSDRWIQIDAALTVGLREALDRNHLPDVAIFYPLAVQGALFRDQSWREKLKSVISKLPITALWLRIHPFGNDAGPSSLRGIIEACQDLHDLKIPIVAEKTGSAGLALLGFGAVGGIESGVTIGTKFDASSLIRPNPKSKGFQVPPRVYLEDLGMFLANKQAEDFFKTPHLKAAFACRDTGCCRHGWQDMISDPRRHFLITRMDEVLRLSQPPEQLRASEYMERMLRPATDRFSRALRAALGDKTRKRIEAERNKFELWRSTLGEMADNRLPTSFSPTVLPAAARLRRRLGA